MTETAIAKESQGPINLPRAPLASPIEEIRKMATAVNWIVSETRYGEGKVDDATAAAALLKIAMDKDPEFLDRLLAERTEVMARRESNSRSREPVWHGKKGRY